jgi:DNA-binding LytR/AlgR family response regulator
MDIRMPELDGLQAARRILADGAQARILILTTFALDSYIYEALRIGASGFVLKDDQPENLIAAILVVAAGDALLSPTITKGVISRFTRVPRPAPDRDLAELTTRDVTHSGSRPRPVQRRNGPRAPHQRGNRRDAHHPPPAEAEPPRDRVQAVVLAYRSGLTEPMG